MFALFCTRALCSPLHDSHTRLPLDWFLYIFYVHIFVVFLTGPGCESRRCPSGNDPMTTNIDETDCTGKSNNGASTAPFITTAVTSSTASSTTSTTVIHTAGARGFAVGDTVTISGHTGNSANTAMNQVFTVASVTSATVVVLTGTGMTASGSAYNGGTIIATFSSAAKGNLCHVECSNRGACNHETGLCSCYSGYYGGACRTMSSLASVEEESVFLSTIVF